MSNQPAYRPRGHAYSCKCGRCPQSRRGDWGIIGPLLFFGGLLAVLGFWPAMIWHGYTDTGGWRWDIHSTIGCAAWWGILIFTFTFAAIGNRRPKPPAAAPQPDRWWEGPAYQQGRPAAVPPPVPPRPDPAVTARLLRGLEAADGYAGLVDEARSAEELDYLQAHGRLPDGWPFREPRRNGGSR